MEQAYGDAPDPEPDTALLDLGVSMLRHTDESGGSLAVRASVTTERRDQRTKDK